MEITINHNGREYSPQLPADMGTIEKIRIANHCEHGTPIAAAAAWYFYCDGSLYVDLCASENSVTQLKAATVTYFLPEIEEI